MRHSSSTEEDKGELGGIYIYKLVLTQPAGFFITRPDQDLGPQAAGQASVWPSVDYLSQLENKQRFRWEHNTSVGMKIGNN